MNDEEREGKETISLIFDYIRGKRKYVWEIDLTPIIHAILREIRSRGEVDFTLGGIALLTSAEIYKRKVEELFQFRTHGIERKMLEVLPRIQVRPMELPVWVPHPMLDISEIVEEVVKEIERRDYGRKEEEIEIPAVEPSESLQEILEYANMLEDKLRRIFSEVAEIDFLTLTRGLSRIEAVRLFVALLQLASEDKIELENIDNNLVIRPLMENG
ncbi:hypothetical protein B6U74_04095 [Candidatus Bathyarchaeota archaeon ex4484_205]|nr:MAG: hypothetical protein B6U74_04095 [Candidatus Bathyarchaeota archaeon ex4484_205]